MKCFTSSISTSSSLKSNLDQIMSSLGLEKTLQIVLKSHLIALIETHFHYLNEFSTRA